MRKDGSVLKKAFGENARKYRKAACFSLLFLFAVLLTGCHGSKGADPFTVPESFDESKQYTITFWAKNDTNYKQAQIYKTAIENFEALYPNIHVELRPYTDYNVIYQDVITNIPTNTTPNVCISYPDHIATYLTGDHLVVNLDELSADPKYGFGGSELKYDGPTKEEMIQSFYDECLLNGSHYGFPYMRSTEALYVNKTLVEKLGYTVPDTVTWDFVFEVCDKAVEKDKEGNYVLNGQKTMIPFIYKSTDNMMIQMLRQKNYGYTNDRGDILCFNDNTKGLLQSIIPHVANGSFSTFKISSYPANFLNVNQCIFAVDSTAGATWMGPDAPLSDLHGAETADVELVVRPIPQFDTENPKMISQGPSVCIFNKEDSGEVLASWLFAQYLLTNEVQLAYSETEGYVPVTKKAQESEEYKDYLSRRGEDNDTYYFAKIDAAKILLENLDNTFITSVYNGSASLRQAAGDLIERVVKSTRRKETIDDAYYENMYKDLVAMYHLDQASAAQKAKETLGEIPGLAIGLIVGVIAVWMILGTVFVVRKTKEKKKR